MKIRSQIQFVIPVAAFSAFSALFSSQTASAADGTWALASSGLWSTPDNWSGGVVADGSGATADFNSVNITADSTVSLDSVRTIGNLVFGDTTISSAAGWILDNNGNAANILTLAGTAPTITVNGLGTGKSATISANIAGTSGFTKSGTGTLALAGLNTYSGGTIINAGTLTQAVNLNANWAGTGPITVQSAGTLILNRNNIANTVTLTLNGGTLNTGNSFPSTVSGPVVLEANSTFNISGTGSIFLNNTVSGPGGAVAIGDPVFEGTREQLDYLLNSARIMAVFAVWEDRGE